ncbi:SHOCT domain-containing protein [Pseudooceanicola sp. 216_PA32_1]|uniref:SHOCT domain-containing protein n=1 Tax=Pseudooceanicola pacificus TaxID=2676438 RepID=A0A844WC96_9RHOB|nr:SHOCT domain-containing protein [Pseudooceanicola pacificus]MWB77762.1 SHOCT domain-containing protein [Pseudooceanicola pacificus]
MTRLTDAGRAALTDIAARHGVSAEAAEQMLLAVAAGHGTQAQFNIQELGGMGQWSRGGMTMVGDMFNTALKARVDALCTDLAELVRGDSTFQVPASSQSQSQSPGPGGISLFVPAPGDWPAELGAPATAGSQNDMRYAWFPQTRRLGIVTGGRMTIYDTGEHQIGGVSQAQSGGQSLTFTSQLGTVYLSDLRVVDGAGNAPAGAEPVPAPNRAAPAPEVPQAPAETTASPAPATAPARTAEAQTADAMSDDQIFSRIERLAGLFDKGILTQAEYETKKAELLARL